MNEAHRNAQPSPRQGNCAAAAHMVRQYSEAPPRVLRAASASTHSAAHSVANHAPYVGSMFTGLTIVSHGSPTIESFEIGWLHTLSACHGDAEVGFIALQASALCTERTYCVSRKPLIPRKCTMRLPQSVEAP